MNSNSRRRAPLGIYAFHLLQERLRPHGWRKRLAHLIAVTRPGVEKGGSGQESAELEKAGFAMLDGLVDAAWVSRVRGLLEARSCQDRWRKHLGKFRFDALPEQTHVADIDDVVDIPEVLALANHPKVLATVGRYFGCMPTIDSIKAWWSLPGHDEAENEQFYHRDNDSIRFLKLFVYLTDVDLESGPHIYVRGSHCSDGCYGRRRYADEEVEQCFGKEKVHVFTGKAGTVFLEDTYGLHKGQLPEKHKRLLLQIRYSVLPTIFMSRHKSSLAAAYVKSNKLSPYANRLFIS